MYNAGFRSWNITSPTTTSSRARSRSSTSKSFSASFPAKRPRPRSSGRLQGRAHLILLASAPLPDDPGSVVPVSFKVAHEIKRRRDRAQARRPGRAAARSRAFRRPPGALHLDRRHPARLARPGAFPRPHRAAGALGDRAGLRRDRRQDEEPVLRDARHARPPAVRGREVRAQRRPTTPSRRST